MGIQVISFTCLLKNKAGMIISKTYNHDVLTASTDKTPMLAGLASGLQNLKKGDKRQIQLSAEEAYGLYDPKKIILYPRNKIQKHLNIGEIISITGKSGSIRSYRVLEFHGDFVSLDSNHPLAGQDLIFEIEALAARDATEDELSEISESEIQTPLLH